MKRANVNQDYFQRMSLVSFKKPILIPLQPHPPQWLFASYQPSLQPGASCTAETSFTAYNPPRLALAYLHHIFWNDIIDSQLRPMGFNRFQSAHHPILRKATYLWRTSLWNLKSPGSPAHAKKKIASSSHIILISFFFRRLNVNIFFRIPRLRKWQDSGRCYIKGESCINYV